MTLSVRIIDTNGNHVPGISFSLRCPKNDIDQAYTSTCEPAKLFVYPGLYIVQLLSDADGNQMPFRGEAEVVLGKDSDIIFYI